MIVYTTIVNERKISQEYLPIVQTLDDFDQYTDCIFQLVSQICSCYIGELASKSNLEKIENDIRFNVTKLRMGSTLHYVDKKELVSFWRKKYEDDQKRFDELTNGIENIYYNYDNNTMRIDPRYLLWLIMNENPMSIFREE